MKKDANWDANAQHEEKKGKEAALTFENFVYMGSVVQDGRGKGVVITTGMQT